MRALVLVVLVAGCAPRPCEDVCQGCCDAQGECQTGRSDSACGASGFACVRCAGASCSPTGFCVTPGTGGAGGGAAATGGGGGTQATVFVTLRYGWTTCCSGGSCVCQDCQLNNCVLTREILESRFSGLRTSAFSACTVTATGSNAHNVDCTNNCTTTTPMCQIFNQPPRADSVISCQRVTTAAITECNWDP